MTTIINSPGNGTNGNDSDGVTGIIVGVIVVLLLIVLFVAYGLPMIRGSVPADNNPSDSINIDVKLPSANNESSGGENN
jgi:hypothetical protein